jgi:hypothetical protein
MHGKKGFTPIMKEIRPSAKCGAKKLLHAALSRRYTLSSFPVLPDAELSALAAKQADARDEWLLHALQDHTAALLEGLPSNVMLSALSGIQADEGTVWLKPDGGRTLTPCWNFSLPTSNSHHHPRSRCEMAGTNSASNRRQTLPPPPVNPGRIQNQRHETSFRRGR